jgi:GT2 family glycosyltransferase
LELQTLPPGVIVCCAAPEDVAGLEVTENARVVYSLPGSARQRNTILDNLPLEAEFLVFFDDDFYPHPDWLQLTVEFFKKNPDVACITGNVVADGILGPGLTPEAAIRRLESASPQEYPWVIEDFSPYGCNMAFRRSAIAGMRFDERLVLYGWLEDRDFGARVRAKGGRLVKLGTAVGVHLGVKSGRVSGRRLGYSQVMNPFYMHRKQTMTTREATRHVLRNLAANTAKSFWPEPYIDRRGRLLGNMIAFGDILAGRCDPERAEQL